MKSTKPKAILIPDKIMVELLTERVTDFRKTANLKDCTSYIKGTASYCLYGINGITGQLVVLADSPTSSDFNQSVTARAKADACCRYDQVIEYRDSGSSSKPKVTILCWELA